MKKLTAPILVLGDNIDTDQILTAEFMKVDYSTTEGYQQLGSLAFCGLPAHCPEVVNPETGKSHYPIVIAGKNFGCGSSREHAPVAMGAAGIKVVIAQSFARIFYRNCMTTGEILPLEIGQALDLKTGDEVSFDMEGKKLYYPSAPEGIDIVSSESFSNLIQAGGLFSYARQIGKIGELILQPTN